VTRRLGGAADGGGSGAGVVAAGRERVGCTGWEEGWRWV
jgi:hypothetical protein